MQTVGAYDAKTHLTRLLDEVARGETVIITKHGVPIARLVPAGPGRKRPIQDVITELREFRRGVRPLEGLTLRDLIEEGRRF